MSWGGRQRLRGAQRSAVFALVAGIFTSIWGPAAHGQPPLHEPRGASGGATAQLSVVEDPEAEACPGALRLRESVAARLGYDPFARPAAGNPEATRVGIRWESWEEGLRAHIQVTRPGEQPGVRELETPYRDCRDLAESVVVAVAIALDADAVVHIYAGPVAPAQPSSGSQQGLLAPDRASTSPPTTSPRPTPAMTPEEATSAASAPSIVGTLGVGLQTGLLPATAAVIHAGAAVEWTGLFVEASGWASFPASQRTDGGEVEASLFAAELAVCGLLRPAYACATLSAGALRGAGHDLAESNEVTKPHAAVGARLGGTLALDARFFVRLDGALQVPLIRTSLLVGDHVVFRTAPLSLRGALLLGLTFD